MRSTQEILLNEASLATDAESKIFDLFSVYAYSLQITVAGVSVAGGVQIQASNDVVSGAQAPTNWANIDSAVTLSAPGTQIINKDGVGYRWLKVSFAENSGMGTLTVTLNAKGG